MESDKNSGGAQLPRSAGTGNGEVSHTPVSQVGTNDFVCEVGKLGSDDEERIRADARLIADRKTVEFDAARAAIAKAEGRS